jgi:hypothetical protein
LPASNGQLVTEVATVTVVDNLALLQLLKISALTLINGVELMQTQKTHLVICDDAIIISEGGGGDFVPGADQLPAFRLSQRIPSPLYQRQFQPLLASVADIPILIALTLVKTQ